MTRAFRFGVITSRAEDGTTWRDRARRAEGLGYSSLLMPDHYQPQWAPTIGLTIAAEATTKLKVGTLVFANDYRHPMMLAKEMATLDLATEGRVEVGLGAGWRRVDYEQSGMVYDRPGVRIERMLESLAVMRALWSTAEPVDFAGAHYTLTAAEGIPQPHTLGGPPVCIGGGGRRILSAAARHADIVAVNATLTAGELTADSAASASPAAFDEKVSWVRAAAGDRLAHIELQMHCPFVSVTDDGDTLARNLAAAFGASPEEAREVPMTLIGTVPELCDTLEQRRARWGFSYVIVPDDAMDAFAPVVARLAGA
jgi:probable F420-dependent oxidoreductase